MGACMQGSLGAKGRCAWGEAEQRAQASAMGVHFSGASAPRRDTRAAQEAAPLGVVHLYAYILHTPTHIDSSLCSEQSH